MTPPTSPETQGKPVSVTRVEYLKGFKLLFLHPHAGMNLLVGSILNLIPLLGPMVLMGWQCEIYQRLQRRHPEYIPRLDFSDFFHFLGRGWVPFVVSLIVVVPFSIIVAMVGLFAALVIGFAAKQGPFGTTMIFFTALLLAMVIFFLLVFLVIFANAALTRAYLTEDFGSSLQFEKILTYAQKTWRRVFIAYLIYFPLSLGLMLVGMLCLYVGLYPVIVIINVAWVFLSWEIYELYLAEGGEVIAVKAPQGLPSEQKISS